MARIFITVSADVWTDADFATLPVEPKGVGHLLMVDNAAHHPEGDFGLDEQGLIHDDGHAPRLTYSGIGVFRPQLLDDWRELVDEATAAQHPPRFKLRPLFERAIARRQLTGSHHRGAWTDVGTPERLRELDQRLRR